MTSLAAAPGAIDATGHAVASTRMLPLRSITSTTTLSPERRMAMSAEPLPINRCRNVTSSRKLGRRGSFKLICKAFGSNSRPRHDCNNDKGVAAAHACGEQATG